MRLDRSITLNFVRPLNRVLGSVRSVANRSIPILMYHSISCEREDNVSPYYRVVTSPGLFRQHMKVLQSLGYRGVDIRTGVDALTSRTANEAKFVVITFDDGFLDNMMVAVPILKEFDFTATIYLPTAWIADERRFFKRRECLTWGEVAELQKVGIHFGSHTVTHPKLMELSWAAIREELRVSKVDIENRLGVVTDHFAYPYAFPESDRQFISGFSDILRNIGYRSCVTTRVGRAQAGDDLLQLKRLPANQCDDASLFRAKLNGDYDWVASAQSGYKHIKSTLFGPRKNPRLKGSASDSVLPVRNTKAMRNDSAHSGN